MRTLTIDDTKYKIEDPVSDLIIMISRERDDLKELVIWMTGCGYDFCQHEYFIKERGRLLKGE